MSMIKSFLKRTNLKDSFNFNEFTLNSSINTTTMIIERALIKNLKFKKVKSWKTIFSSVKF